ncbi:hypothetical protein POTOM_060413 [Populus tomentosa]|uniref:Uncharacterized protein n=1 Tax=Populus tomentosa TaxID=118781 RepID=A0A8X8BYZ6_POPTO|nr:hypothetical protein POTOM_060413 [Populus tomentosa]
MRTLSPEILYWAQMGFMGRGNQQGLMKGASNPHDPPPDGGPIYKACTVVYMNPNLKFDDLNCAVNVANAIVHTRRTIDFTIGLQDGTLDRVRGHLAVVKKTHSTHHIYSLYCFRSAIRSLSLFSCSRSLFPVFFLSQVDGGSSPVWVPDAGRRSRRRCPKIPPVGCDSFSFYKAKIGGNGQPPKCPVTGLLSAFNAET